MTGLTICNDWKVAWLFNIRGADIQYNPVVVSHAIVTAHCSGDNAILFAPAEAITDPVRQHLTSAGITVRLPRF